MVLRKRFRINTTAVWSVGVTVIPGGEHSLSIYLNFLRVAVYIGLGKAYNE